MNDLIKAILSRELDKLDSLSKTSLEPLSPADVRSLDMLVKAYRAFVDPAPATSAAAPAAVDPAQISTEVLLDGLQGQPT